MMEHTTDRLFWTLSAIIIAALMLTVSVKVFPKATQDVIAQFSGLVRQADTSTNAIGQATNSADLANGINTSNNDAITNNNNSLEQGIVDGQNTGTVNQATSDALVSQNNKIVDLQNAVDKLNQQNTLYGSSITTLQTSLQQANSKNDALNSQLQQALTDATNNKNLSAAQIADLQAKNNDLYNKINALNSAANTQAQQYQGKISDIQSQIQSAVNNDSEDKDQKIASLNTQLSSVNQQLSDLSNTVSAANTAAQNTMNGIQQQVNNNASNISSNSNNLQQIANSVTNAQNTAASAQTTANNANNTANNANSTATNNASLIAALQSQLTQTQQQLTNAQTASDNTIANTTQTVTVSDMDKLVTPGVYNFAGNLNIANLPSDEKDAWDTVTVTVSKGSVTQIIQNQKHLMWRVISQTQDWTDNPWREVVTTDDLSNNSIFDKHVFSGTLDQLAAEPDGNYHLMGTDLGSGMSSYALAVKTHSDDNIAICLYDGNGISVNMRDGNGWRGWQTMANQNQINNLNNQITNLSNEITSLQGQVTNLNNTAVIYHDDQPISGNGDLLDTMVQKQRGVYMLINFQGSDGPAGVNMSYGVIEKNSLPTTGDFSIKVIPTNDTSAYFNVYNGWNHTWNGWRAMAPTAQHSPFPGLDGILNSADGTYTVTYWGDQNGLPYNMNGIITKTSNNGGGDSFYTLHDIDQNRYFVNVHNWSGWRGWKELTH